jgi:hypothetical protein
MAARGQTLRQKTPAKPEPGKKTGKIRTKSKKSIIIELNRIKTILNFKRGFSPEFRNS